MYFNVATPLTKVYNYLTLITARDFYPYETARLVLLRRFAISSTWPDAVCQSHAHVTRVRLT